MLASGVMGDRVLILVLVLNLAAVAGAMPHSSTSRRLAESSPAVHPLAEGLELEGSTKRRRMDGAPTGGSPECPCLDIGSPKISDARAAFLAMGLPVRASPYRWAV